MMTVKDAPLVYETLLTSPGMNNVVKITLAMNRKTLLMLTKTIEVCADKEEVKEGVLSVMDKSISDELKSVASGLLGKGGLNELNTKLNVFSLKQTFVFCWE